MKNYSATTATYLTSSGLTKVYVRDAATGQRILRFVTRDQLKAIRRNGRSVEVPE